MTNRATFLRLGAALALFAIACDPDEVTEANDNPNDPTNAPSAALFTNATRSGVGRWLDGVGLPRYGFLAQHFAEVQYPESDQYVRLQASGTTGLFDNSYAVELQDFQLVINRGLEAAEPGLYGPPMVMKSWEVGMLTDVFGDVPYTEAFQADAGILSPAYDPQEAIYDSLFAMLDRAATDLAGASNELGDGDPIYGGDPDSWIRFANSLRARHALRVVDVDAALADAELTAALADPAALITTNDDNAQLEWPGDGIYDNPWASNFETRDDHRISNRLLILLRDYSDPRLEIYAQPAQDPQADVAGVTLGFCPSGSAPCYVGLYNALEHSVSSEVIPNTSRVGMVFMPGATSYGVTGGTGASFPSFLMTAAEVEFIRAEAAERSLGGLTPGQAQAFYNAGITRSMEMWDVAPADIAAYLAEPEVAYNTAGTTADRLKQIAIQKWLALIIDPIQAWTNFRRTCQPAILEPGPDALTDAIPSRLQYSTTEQAVNRANYNLAVDEQGPDAFTTRVWWNTNAESAPTFEAGCGER